MMDNMSASVAECGGNASSGAASAFPVGAVEGAASEAEFDVYVYLSNFYGPQRQPPEKLIPLTIVYIGEIERETDSALGLEEGLLIGLVILCECIAPT